MNELTPQECLALLDAGRVAHLGLVDDGEPYVTPLSYVIIDGDLYFRTGPGRRVDALQASPRVCIEVSHDDGDDGWASIIFWGDARFIEDPPQRADVVSALLGKYHSDSLLGIPTPGALPAEERFVIAVTPEGMSGRSSGSGWSARTRPGRL